MLATLLLRLGAAAGMVVAVVAEIGDCGSPQCAEEIKVSRPRVQGLDAGEILALRSRGETWRAIAARLGVGLGTVVRAAEDCSFTFQNPSCDEVQPGFARDDMPRFLAG